MSSSSVRSETLSFAFTQILYIHEQLEALRRGVESHHDSQQLILQASTIENSVRQLVLFFVEAHLDYQAKQMLETDILGQNVAPILDDVKRIIRLAYQPDPLRSLPIDR
ncbi:MAG: hypothetical protein J0M33_02510 [Anaerolineae bacterium]|nr:hypothetical protein [Anaerolineae bacterium]